jgi:hypothetical protein
MTSSVPSAVADLRARPVGDVLDHVEQSLLLRLERDTVVRKRRTVGAKSDRGTWVRIERRGIARIHEQGWNGTECAAILEGVVQPQWFASVAWRDPAEAVMWRADETEVLPGEPVKPGGVLTADPGLPSAWWEALNASLDALATQKTTRIATPDTVIITPDHVTESIRSVFPEVDGTTIEQWAPAHADMNWANVAGPVFCLFDWEDWGMAPRGLDSASLWGNSLAVRGLAERVRRERRVLDSRDGKVMMLFVLSKIAGPYANIDDPRFEPARQEAARLIEDLQVG